MNPKILVAGYYGFNNAGDELVLRTLLEQFAGSERPYETSVLGLPDRWSPRAVLRSVWRCDILVLGGGGLLQDETGTLSLWYYLSLLWLAFFFRKKVVLLSQGIGPVLCTAHRFLVRFTMRFADLISVRDRESLRFLEGVPTKNPVRLSADPVFLLKPASLKFVGPESGQKIIVIPRRIRDRTEIERNNFWIELGKGILNFSQNRNLEIVLVPFQPEFDREALLSIGTVLGDKAVIRSPDSLDRLLETLSMAGIVVSMRLHGLILSALLEKPALGISADPKLESFTREFAYPPELEPILSPDQVVAGLAEKKLEILWENQSALVRAAKDKVPELKMRALSGFECLADPGTL